MAVMDEFKEEREALKNASLSKKLKYFWDYNRGKVFIGIILILIAGGFISAQLSKKEQVVSGVFLNCFEQEYILGEFSKEFLEENEFNPKKQETYFVTDLPYQADEKAADANMDVNQALYVYASSGVMDFIVSDPATMDDLAKKYFFIDLREVLTEEECKALESYFITYENEEGEEVPVLLNIGKNEKMAKAYGEEYETLQMGVMLDNSHPENMNIFIEYLMK